MATAQRVMLLANLDAEDPDADTLQILLTLVARGAAHGRPALRDRPRLLIAEILDESAIPAARAAIRESDARAFIVPSERLLGLMMAAVIRRPGVKALLTRLLASHGHELYTCYFDVPGLAYRASQAPRLPAAPEAAMATLLAQSQGRRLIPVGLLANPAAAERHEHDVEVCLNPGDGRRRGDAPWSGFIALAADFAAIRGFSESLVQGPAIPGPEPRDRTPRTFHRAAMAPLRRALICGFRPATVSLLEALAVAAPAGEILVLVADEATRAAAIDALDARTQLARRHLLSSQHLVFRPTGDGTFTAIPADSDRESGAGCEKRT